MPLKDLSQDQLELKDQLINNFDEIKLLVVATPDGSTESINEPRVEYFNPDDCIFRLSLPSRRFVDIPLTRIREVHLCD